MRNMWKVAVAFTLALGVGGALAQAQPLIAGNTAAFGCGPIATSHFTLGTVIHQFYPDGAGGSNCPDNPVNHHNGRGLAIGGTEVFYTELDEVAGPDPGFGPSASIHVATYNAGVGSGDLRLLPHPRPGSGIQDLTFANNILYVLTGYDTQIPIVYGLNPLNGEVIKPGVTIPRIGFSDNSVDGFAVLPNGNFLMNNMGTSCIYAEYSSTDGHFIGNIFNVPGGAGQCTGVDTDGTSLYFMTDFTAITRTDLAGNMTGYSFFDGPGGEVYIMDISLVHPITSIADTGNGHFVFSLRNTEDIDSRFDFRAELLKNGAVVATGLTRCQVVNASATPGNNVPVAVGLPGIVRLVSGDVLSMRVSVRRGTNPNDTVCPGHLADNNGLRIFYDSTGTPSQFDMTIFPNPSQIYFFHSDGTTCTDVLGESQPTATLNRTLSNVAPVGASVRCKEVTSNITFAGGNPWNVFSTWFLAPLP
jgi:hypothetical protein